MSNSRKQKTKRDSKRKRIQSNGTPKKKKASAHISSAQHLSRSPPSRRVMLRWEKSTLIKECKKHKVATTGSKSDMADRILNKIDLDVSRTSKSYQRKPLNKSPKAQKIKSDNRKTKRKDAGKIVLEKRDTTTKHNGTHTKRKQILTRRVMIGWNRAKLIKQCKKHNVSTAGSKADMVDRILNKTSSSGTKEHIELQISISKKTQSTKKQKQKNKQISEIKNNESNYVIPSRKQLLQLSKPKLIKKCKKYNVVSTGSKNDMIDRILNKMETQKRRKNQRKSNETNSNKAGVSGNFDFLNGCNCIRFFDTDGDKKSKKLLVIGCILVCILGVLLAVILIPVSIRTIEFDEYAIRYDNLEKKGHDEAYTEGRYVFTPNSKLFTYERLIQNLALNLECLTSDGVLMNVNVTILYLIPQSSVYKIWNEYGRENNINHYFKLIAGDSVRDSISIFAARDFYGKRFYIQNQIEKDLFNAVQNGHSYVDIASVIMTGYKYPDLLTEVINIKRISENDIEIAKNEIAGNITNAETTLLIAQIYAEKLMIQAESEKRSILIEAHSKAKAIQQRFEYMSTLMVRLKSMYNMTTTEFLNGWLTASVLLNSHYMYTKTHVNNPKNVLNFEKCSVCSI